MRAAQLKLARDPLKHLVHLNEVAALAGDVATRGFQALDNGDKEMEAELDHRLKWLGLFHKRKHHYGRFMMRLKLPGGFVTAPQLRVLADAIAKYGDDAIVHFGGSHKFLSSFARTPIVLDGVAYPTAEHAFQAQKTTDAATRARIAAAHTPDAAKNLARKMPKALVTPGWFDGGVRDDAMKKVIEAKVRPSRCRLVCAAFLP